MPSACETSSLFIQAGPTLGVGIIGSKIEWYGYANGDANYFDFAKRFDFGVCGRVGVEFSKYLISAGVNYGVLKVFDTGGHNLSINLGVAYMF